MINEIVGWISLALVPISGAVLGMHFHRSDYLGGYDAYPRRLMRLGHISFFGLGVLNILFALSADRINLAPWHFASASYAFVIGNITMPLACFVNAYRPKFKPLFVIPVACVIHGTLTTAFGVAR